MHIRVRDKSIDYIQRIDQTIKGQGSLVCMYLLDIIDLSRSLLSLSNRRQKPFALYLTHEKLIETYARDGEKRMYPPSQHKSLSKRYKLVKLSKDIFFQFSLPPSTLLVSNFVLFSLWILEREHYLLVYDEETQRSKLILLPILRSFAFADFLNVNMKG